MKINIQSRIINYGAFANLFSFFDINSDDRNRLHTRK